MILVEVYEYKSLRQLFVTSVNNSVEAATICIDISSIANTGINFRVLPDDSEEEHSLEVISQVYCEYALKAIDYWKSKAENTRK